MNLVPPTGATKDEPRVSASLNPRWSYESARGRGAGAERLHIFGWQSDAPSHQKRTLAGDMTLSLAALQRSAVLDERSRIAREIHDTLIQDFAGIVLHLQAALRADDAEASSAADCL